MQFLAVLRRKTETFSDADFAPLLDNEAEQARMLYTRGSIRQIWSRGDTAGACLLLEAEDLEAARAVLRELPLIATEMLEISSLVPLKPYRGFAPRG